MESAWSRETRNAHILVGKYHGKRPCRMSHIDTRIILKWALYGWFSISAMCEILSV
jgi:hypothetical protein